MPSPYNSLSFALEILRLLADRAYSRQELAETLAQFLEAHGKPSNDALQKVTRTIRKLRDCGFEIESAPYHPYRLKDSNFPVILSAEQRQALYLATHVLEQMGFSAPAGQLKRIHQTRDSDRPSDFQADFSPPVDYSKAELPKTVATLQNRIEKACRFAIRYQSSGGESKMWDIDRAELRLHNGVLYLFAYVPQWQPRYSPAPSFEQNIIFRTDRILDICAASAHRWVFSSFPTATITYRMGGPLKRYQPRRYHEKITDQTPDYVEITTEEDCLFWFRQRILQYGANVRVISPDWLVDIIRQELIQACEQYDAG